MDGQTCLCQRDAACACCMAGKQLVDAFLVNLATASACLTYTQPTPNLQLLRWNSFCTAWCRSPLSCCMPLRKPQCYFACTDACRSQLGQQPAVMLEATYPLTAAPPKPGLPVTKLHHAAMQQCQKSLRAACLVALPRRCPMPAALTQPHALNVSCRSPPLKLGLLSLLASAGRHLLQLDDGGELGPALLLIGLCSSQGRRFYSIHRSSRRLLCLAQARADG